MGFPYARFLASGSNQPYIQQFLKPLTVPRMAQQLPFPVNLAQYLLTRGQHPVRATGFLVLGVMLLVSLASGAALPDFPGSPFSDPVEILGSFLLFALLSAYLLMCLLAGIRSNNQTHGQLQSQLPMDFTLNRYQRVPWWPLPVALAILFALWGNVNWSGMVLDASAPGFLTSVMLIAGQTIMWAIVGLVLFISSHECWILGKLGRVVAIDLYNLDKLNGFGRAGLNNFLMVVGALAITTVQSIDQEFRLVNYLNGLIVGIPAAMALIALPIASLPRRIRSAKQAELIRLDREIDAAPRGTASDELLRLNALLSRREFIKGLRHWPMDLSIFSRFFLYVLIPPLAWVGAALMEMYLDSMLAG